MTTKKSGLLIFLLGCLPSLTLAAPTNHIQIKVSGLKSGDALILLNDHGNDRLTIPDSSNPQAQLNGTFSMPTAMALNDVISVTANDSYTPGLACSITGNQGVTVEQTGMQPVQVACGHPQAAQKAGGQPRGSVSGAVGQADLNSSGGGSAMPDLDNSSAGESGSGDNLILPGQASAPALAENNPAKPALDNAGGSENGDNLTLPQAASVQLSSGVNSSQSQQAQSGSQGQNDGGVEPDSMPTQWNCYTIDSPLAPQNNRFTEITDINMKGDIVGNFGPMPHRQAFYSHPAPGKTSWRFNWVPQYPSSHWSLYSVSSSAKKTVARSLMDEHYQGGFYIDSNGLKHGWSYSQKSKNYYDWGPDIILGVGTVLVLTDSACHGRGGNHCHTGHSSDDEMVAFDSTTGTSYYMSVETDTWTLDYKQALNISSDAVATAMSEAQIKSTDDNPKDPSKYQATIAGNSNEGIWVYDQGSKNPQYTLIGEYPGGKQTKAYCANWPGDVVGTYVDSQTVTNGYILYNAGHAQQKWTQFQCASWTGLPAGATVKDIYIYGSTDKHNLSGAYKDSTGVTHGLVAVPAS